MSAEGGTNMALAATHASTRPTPAARAAVVRVWDPFVRAFHWLLVTGFLANYFELVRPGRYSHRVIGYVVLGLIAARLLWGFLGPRHARFVDFVTHPRSIFAHFKAVVIGQDGRYLDHNPAGGAMILALLAVTVLVGATGWLSRTGWFFGIKWMDEVHGILANAMFALVCVHVLGVVHGSWRHRENLVLSMLTG
ncbi:MAG: cytochrome b/b6 domain-containing protein [Dongiaceae bacterium]